MAQFIQKVTLLTIQTAAKLLLNTVNLLSEKTKSSLQLKKLLPVQQAEFTLQVFLK